MKEIDEFLYLPKILKLNQEEVKNLNRSTTNELIETVIYIKKKLSNYKVQVLMDLQQTPIRLLKENYIQPFPKFCKENRNSRTTKSVLRTTINLIPKLGKDTGNKTKLQIVIPDEQRYKILNKY